MERFGIESGRLRGMQQSAGQAVGFTLPHFALRPRRDHGGDPPNSKIKVTGKGGPRRHAPRDDRPHRGRKKPGW